MKAKLFILAAILCSAFTFTSCDNDDDNVTTAIPEAIEALIQQLYPGATIKDIEPEYNGTEVDIIHENIKKEVLVDANYKWLYTKWEITVNQVPENIMAEFRSSDYATYKIDDIYIIEDASGRYYRFELEQGKKEITVDFGKN